MLKAFVDDKLRVTKMMRLDSEWMENIAGKGENVGYQHILLFPCF